MKTRLTLNVFAVSILCLLCCSLAQAQASRTFVSGVGNDADPCSRTAPCKTFGGAISKTIEGGEIDVLDPGGFGSVTITKSITIDGGTGSGWASILASGTNGVVVNVSTNPTTAVVTLRHISVNGIKNCVTLGCTGINGIRFLAGKRLHVEEVEVFGFSTNGLDVNNSTTNPVVSVQNSTFSNITGSGISITATTSVAAVVDSIAVKQCGTGVSSAANSVATIRNSNVALNTTGVNTANGSQTNITGSTFANQITGVTVVAGATIRLDNNVFANNATGVNNSGTAQSANNNKFFGNTTDVSGAALTNCTATCVK